MRTTLIIKLHFNNKWYICNRHSDSSLDFLFNKRDPKISPFYDFWNLSVLPDNFNKHKLFNFFTCDNFEILDELNFENMYREDQKEINKIKNYYIEKFKLSDGDNLDNNCLKDILHESRKEIIQKINDFNYIFYKQLKHYYETEKEELNNILFSVLNALNNKKYINLFANKFVSTNQNIQWELINKINKDENIPFDISYKIENNLYYPIILSKQICSDEIINKLLFLQKKDDEILSYSAIVNDVYFNSKSLLEFYYKDIDIKIKLVLIMLYYYLQNYDYILVERYKCIYFDNNLLTTIYNDIINNENFLKFKTNII